MSCTVCKERVNNSLLRVESPICQNGHALGTWTACNNKDERHVYLKLGPATCPYCSASAGGRIADGSKVKCLKAATDGRMCVARPYLWMKDGPPCFLNHVDKMKLA